MKRLGDTVDTEFNMDAALEGIQLSDGVQAGYFLALLSYPLG